MDACLDIASGAGDAILQVYASDFEVYTKADASPLTQADLAANRLIGQGLRAITPELPLLSEESAEVDFSQRRSWHRYWLIDPLDGTKEFVRRNGEFTVNIALIEDGVPILGVIHAPALKISYAGAAGLGAWRIEADRRQSIRTRRTAMPPVVVISKSHRNPALHAFLQRLPAHRAISRGSSLKFCLIAEGSADFYPRTGPTSEWDTGAGQALVEAAGGAVVTLADWRPLRYNTKASLLNPDFAVIGDSSYGWQQRLVPAA